MNLLNPDEQMPGQSQDVLSSTEGDSQATGGGGEQQQAPQPAAQPQATAGARGRVMSRNVDRAQAPTDMGRISSNIGQAKQNIQNEANAYMGSATTPYQGDVKSELQGYISGENSDLGTRLRAAPERMADIELSDTKVNDVDLLENDAGIREMFRRSQDPEGRIGEAALDTALLRRNQPFQMQRGDVLNSYRQLQEERKKIEEESRPAAQAARDAAAEAWKGSVRTEAGSMATALDDAARQQEALFDADLAGVSESQRLGIDDEAQRFADELAGGYTDPFMQKAIRESFGAGSLYSPDTIDASAYYTPGTLTADQTDFRQFYGEPEAQKFEKIMALLGGGETRMAGPYAGKKASEVYGGGLQKDPLRQAILGRATARADEARKGSEQMAADKKTREDESAATKAAASTQKNQERNTRIAELNRRGVSKEDMNAQDRALYESLSDAEKKQYDADMDVSWTKRDPNKWIV